MIFYVSIKLNLKFITKLNPIIFCSKNALNLNFKLIIYQKNTSLTNCYLSSTTFIGVLYSNSDKKSPIKSSGKESLQTNKPIVTSKTIRLLSKNEIFGTYTPCLLHVIVKLLPLGARPLYFCEPKGTEFITHGVFFIFFELR